MHISTGIIDAPTSVVAGAVAVAGVAACVWRSRRDGVAGDERLAPIAGLVAAFIFAVQMLNFPVLPGVSGHLLGGALAAILVGPYVGALCVTLVLVVQALLFADGGLTALGLNVVNMGIVGTFVGYGTVILLIRLIRPADPGRLALLAAIGAFVNVVIAAQGFVIEYAIGGTADVSLAAIAGAMGGFHVLIGIGEAIITAITVGAVAKVRPDLIYLLRGREQPGLTIRQSTLETA